jgi:hypothetical protein
VKQKRRQNPGTLMEIAGTLSSNDPYYAYLEFVLRNVIREIGKRLVRYLAEEEVAALDGTRHLILLFHAHAKLLLKVLEVFVCTAPRRRDGVQPVYGKQLSFDKLNQLVYGVSAELHKV